MVCDVECALVCEGVGCCLSGGEEILYKLSPCLPGLSATLDCIPLTLMSSASAVLLDCIRLTLMCSGFLRSSEEDKGKGPTYLQRMLAGGTSGAIGISVANPTELIKIRMQVRVRDLLTLRL